MISAARAGACLLGLAVGAFAPALRGQTAPEAPGGVTSQSAVEAGALAPAPVPPAAPIDAAQLAGRPRIAVLPFGGVAELDERDRWLGAALQEMLCWRLRRHPGLIAISTERLWQAQREGEEENAPPAWEAVARGLGAQWVLSGTLAGNPDSLQATFTLRRLDLSAADKSQQAPAGRLFDVLDHGTRWAVGALNAPAPDGPAGRHLLSPPCRTPKALESYVKALEAFRNERPRDTAHYLREALDNDPTFRAALLLQVEVELRVAARKTLRTAAARLALLFELCRRDEDPLDLATTEIAHGVLNGLEQAYDAAAARFGRALSIGRTQRDPYLQIAAMTSLSSLYLGMLPPEGATLSDEQREAFSRANFTRAAEWQKAVLASLELLGDEASIAPTASRLAMTCERLALDEQALQYHQRTLEAARRMGSRRAEATALLLIAQWNARQQRWEDALSAIQRCAQVAPESALASVIAARASIQRGKGDHAAALADYEAALERLRKSEDLTNQMLCLREAATLRWEVQDRRTAVRDLREAIDIAHALASGIEKNLQQTLDGWLQQAPELAGAKPKSTKPAAKPPK